MWRRPSSPSAASWMVRKPSCCRPVRTRERMVCWSSTTRQGIEEGAGISAFHFFVREVADGGAELLQGELALDRAQFVGCAGHAVDDAGRLVLAQRLGAGLPHGEETAGAVPAHAGQDPADGMLLGGPGHG